MKLDKEQQEFVEQILVIVHWGEWSNDRNTPSFDHWKKSIDKLEIFEANKKEFLKIKGL